MGLYFDVIGVLVCCHGWTRMAIGQHEFSL